MAGQIIVTARNNFVERPWGGTRLRAFKSLCPLPDQVRLTGSGLGESFELAAFDDDAEAARYPSKVADRDGTAWALPELIREHADVLLGQEWIEKYGRCIPLLPKFLNVRELLSVQGHPEGHTEAYVVVDAEPGATIRLGFRQAVDPVEFGRVLEEGRQRQVELAGLLGEQTDWLALQSILGGWFADKGSDAQTIIPELMALSGAAAGGAWADKAAALADSLKRTYWHVLDAMNEIELVPGQVIHNSIPQRILDAEQRIAAAEVHALGNPEQREFVMLEVRRPGPTLRAWDNVRFPMRDVDLVAALDVLNLSPTRPEEFVCDRQPGQGRGHSVSVDSPYFRIEHVELAVGQSFEAAGEDPHCLHVLAGSVEIATEKGVDTTILRCGDSAFVPREVHGWRGVARDADLHLVKVHLP
jgi:mannose-6-phosphate isomerase class I